MADEPEPLFQPGQRDDGRWIYTVRLSSGERVPFGRCGAGPGHESADEPGPA